MSIKTIQIIGSGGHAKVVIQTLIERHPDICVELFDDDSKGHGQELYGCPIRGPVSLCQNNENTGIHLAIGNNRVREKIVQQLQCESNLFSIISDKACISPRATIAPGCLVTHQSLIGPDTRMGKACIINHSASIDHDCEIGDYVHIAPNATLPGEVKVGHGCLIGAGATLLPGITIGDWTIIGAGAVVTRDVPSGVTVVGNPARQIGHNNE